MTSHALSSSRTISSASDSSMRLSTVHMVGADWDEEGLETIAGSPPNHMTINPMVNGAVARESEPGSASDGDEGESDDGQIEEHVEAHLDQSPNLVGL